MTNQSTTTNAAKEPDEDPDDKEARTSGLVWYHLMAKSWECPGHPESYESSDCIGAIYVG